MSEGQKSHLTLKGDGVQVAKDIDESLARRVMVIVLGGAADAAEAEPAVVQTNPAQRAAAPKSNAKDFMAAKKPRTDVERVTCLGFYLTHHMDTPQFRTQDISKLNGGAHQPKLANPTVAVNNASRQKYLTPAGNGMKCVTTLGEELVGALPDREAVKKALAAQPARRRRRAAKAPSPKTK